MEEFTRKTLEDWRDELLQELKEIGDTQRALEEKVRIYRVRYRFAKELKYPTLADKIANPILDKLENVEDEVENHKSETKNRVEEIELLINSINKHLVK